MKELNDTNKALLQHSKKYQYLYISFINKLFQYYDKTEILNFWKAPTEEKVHDFIISDKAIEIKTKTSKNIINISSYEQLFTELPKLFLYVYTISESDENNGFTVYDIIEKIKKLLSDEYLVLYFERLLVDYGFVPLKEYREIYFKFIKEEIFEVTTGFPRIENKPDAITNLKYSIKVDKIEKFKIDKKDLF